MLIRRKLWLWLIGVLIIALCLVGISPLTALVGLSGQSAMGHCTVLAKRLQYIARELEYHPSSAPGAPGYYIWAPENYVPDFTFVIYTMNGHHVQTGGYDAVLVNRTQTEAQAVLNQYQVGKTYPCWYNPDAPSHTWLSSEDIGNEGFPLIPVALILVSMLELGLTISMLREARRRRR